MMPNNNLYQRYQRQIILKEFGTAAQLKLQQSRVLVIGAGGLGCPVLQYLTAAGIGTIGIADEDVVALTNLHRQVLYTMNDIGLSKAEVAAKKLSELNDEISFHVYNTRLTNKNALDIIAGYNIIVDGTDNFASRYMINDACVLLDKPLVYGAISKFEGQVAVFNIKINEEEPAVNYRDVFPEPPKDDEILNCAEAGVLGVLPGITGTMMSNEAIKLITGIGTPLINTMLTYNALDNSLYQFKLSPDKEAQNLIPEDETAFVNMNYEWLCSSETNKYFEIDVMQFDDFINDSNTLIIDVREKDEQPEVDEFDHLQIPLPELINNQSLIDNSRIILFCQSGTRSLKAAKLLDEFFNHSKKIYSLKKGISEWKKKHSIHVA